MVGNNDLVPDYRARRERERLEAEERRDRARIEQRSTEHSPAVRVRIWEDLHQVRLPTGASHPIVPLVAQQTGLTVAEVLEVQSQRAGRGAAPASGEQSATSSTPRP